MPSLLRLFAEHALAAKPTSIRHQVLQATDEGAAVAFDPTEVVETFFNVFKDTIVSDCCSVINRENREQRVGPVYNFYIFRKSIS